MLALFAVAMLVVPRDTPAPAVAIPPPSYAPMPLVPRFEPTPPRVPQAPIAHAPGAGIPVPVPLQPDEVIAPPSATHVAGTGTADAEPYAGPAISSAPPPVIEDTLPARGVTIHVDQPPVAIAQPLPVYPDMARETGIEGHVRVYILIGKDGRVLRAELDDRVHVPVLDAAALEAAKRWVFTPAYLHGHPVAVWDALPFEFTLH
jgi:protein TonB